MGALLVPCEARDVALGLTVPAIGRTAMARDAAGDGRDH